MLYYASFPQRARKQIGVPERSVNMQLSFSILEDPIADNNLWQQLSQAQQKAIVDVLTRLIAQVAMSQLNEEQNDD
jgi:hypothetical protein